MAVTLRKVLQYAFVVLAVTMGMGIYLFRKSRRIYSLEAYGFEKKRCLSTSSGPTNGVKSRVRSFGRARKYVSSNECKDVCTSVQPDAGLCIQNKALVGPTLHCLPSLLIIGAMKSGTGTMMRWLNEHPQLRSGTGAANKNEIHFFPFSGQCAWTQYIDYFALSSNDIQYDGTTTGTMQDPRSRVPQTFDKSPDYMRSPAAMTQIREMLPSVKLLVLLREPVRRTISAFNHNCKHKRYGIRRQGAWAVRVRRAGREPRSDEVTPGAVVRLEWAAEEAAKGNLLKCDDSACVALSEGQVRDCFQVLPYPCRASDFNSYYNGEVTALLQGKDERQRGRLHEAARNELSFGYYDDQLETVYSLYGDDPKPRPGGVLGRGGNSSSTDRSRPVEVLFQEEMVRDTPGVVARVLSWLHLPPLSLPTSQSLAASQGPLASAPGRRVSRDLAAEVERSYPTLYKALQRLYSHHNTRLATLLAERSGPGTTLPPEWAY